MKLISVQKLWDRAAHNAFTDLLRYHGRWYGFRESEGHAAKEGAIRALTSEDGKSWSSVALLTKPGWDLRGPKLSVTPDDRLMMNSAAVAWDLKNPDPALRLSKTQSMVWFSKDGRKWTKGIEIGDQDYWLWRATRARRISIWPSCVSARGG